MNLGRLTSDMLIQSLYEYDILFVVVTKRQFGKDEAYDVLGAAKFLKNNNQTKNQKIIGYGFSMGAVSLI